MPLPPDSRMKPGVRPPANPMSQTFLNASGPSLLPFEPQRPSLGFARLALGLALAALGSLQAAEIPFELQSRDPVSGALLHRTERIDPQRVGVIAVDVWNFHWCKTATMRVDAFVPRINHALQEARALGMTVMLCPSDVVENYAGYPQREAVFALPRVRVPKVVEISCPPAPDAGGCACGTERCGGNYGWDGMHPGLSIADTDWMPDTQAEVYALCQQRGLTHLIYVGFHTQVCLLGKPMGLRAMKSAGLQCILARDMTDAHPGYNPARQFTPDLNTEQVVEHFEKHLASTIDLQAELTRLGRWNPATPLDPVRVTPWGTHARPHLFEKEVVVTLTTPFQAGAEIRYTLDGTEPNPGSLLYRQPILITNTASFRAAAFRKDLLVARESQGVFYKLPPTPPRPEAPLTDLTPVRNVGFGHTYGGTVRYSGHFQAPQKNKSNIGLPLKLNRRTYEQGLGVHAPCAMTFELKPGYKQFVAVAGVDENLVQQSHGSNLARYPSVIFKVFIDHVERAASPVMRMQSLAWRFQVDIPEHSKTITLVAMDAGDGHHQDLANWADAGFLLSPH